MKRIVFYILYITLLGTISAYSQDSDVEKLLSKGDYSSALSYIKNAYHNDTANKDRYYDLYLYYKEIHNPNNDYVSALFYAQLYKEQNEKDKTINLNSLAEEALGVIYQKQDIDALNRYITITDNYPQLQQEATRIRDRLAFEKTEKSESVEEYEQFIKNYPNAIQVDQARSWLNEHLMKDILKSNDAEKLREFIKSTNNASYRKQALEQLDKITFKQVLQENTVEAYDRYIKDFPNGEYIVMARNKRESAQYDKYVNEGTISDMIFFLRNNSKNDKNYQLVFDKLKLYSSIHYSIPAMLVLDSIEHNDGDLKTFAKRYVSDLSLSSIQRITDAFPNLKTLDYIVEAEQKAKAIQTLISKPKLTAEDYRKNKSLLTNLNARQSTFLFKRFYELNETLPKNKAISFNLGWDSHFLAFRQAKKMELDLVLTEGSGGVNKQAIDVKSFGLDIEAKDIFVSDDKKIILFSKADYDGYDSYPDSENKDIYYSIFKEGKWQKPLPVVSPVNSRFNETHPVLSADKKTLWFSSDRDLNFGALDIYVSHREDTKDWNSWSEPILLGEDINTSDDDFVLKVEDNMLVLTQDENTTEENYIYLEGNTQLNFVSGKVKSAHNDFSNSKLYIYNSKDFSLINIVTPNDKGYFAFIRPSVSYALYLQKSNYYSPITDSTDITLYSIEDLAANSDIITVNSFFNPKNPLELSKRGEMELLLLANVFKSKPYILNLEVHANKGFKKDSEEELSVKQADVIRNFLIKKGGVNEARLITNGLGTNKVVQGWEGMDCIDISILDK